MVVPRADARPPKHLNIGRVLPEIEGKPGRNGLIVFVQENRNQGDDYHQGPSGIYSYNPRTRRYSLLVKSKHASHPRFTAGGDKIVFMDGENRYDRRVFTMNPDGSGRTEIAAALTDYPAPTLIPGDKVWFVNEEHEAMTVKIDGSGLRSLGKIRGEVTVGSATAGGGKVVYQSEPGRRNVDIFIYNRSTGKHTRLTDGPGWESEPRISPDGRWVTFLREDNDEIWIMRANGKRKSRVAYATGDLGFGEPMFSPDGSSMLTKVYYGRIASYLTRFALDIRGFHNIERSGSVYLRDADWQSR